jgi:hypothetical protein
MQLYDGCGCSYTRAEAKTGGLHAVAVVDWRRIRLFPSTSLCRRLLRQNGHDLVIHHSRSNRPSTSVLRVDSSIHIATPIFHPELACPEPSGPPT